MTVIPVRWPAAAAMGLVGAIGAMAFLWPFFASAEFVTNHGNDTPWLFAGILALLTLVCLAEVTSGRLDAKTIAVLGVTAAAGGAMRVLSAGTAGLEPMFFIIIVAGRVLGPGVGFVGGALALLTGGLLTGGVGPWLPFQMICAGAIGLGAGLLPGRPGARSERWVLAGYALTSGVIFGLFMNLWFWPFLGANAPSGMAALAAADRSGDERGGGRARSHPASVPRSGAVATAPWCPAARGARSPEDESNATSEPKAARRAARRKTRSRAGPATVTRMALSTPRGTSHARDVAR